MDLEFKIEGSEVSSIKKGVCRLECVVLVEQMRCALVCVEIEVTHIHTCMHTYTHARIHSQTNARISTFTRISVEALVHTRRL